jgi:hypothetical protein
MALRSSKRVGADGLHQIVCTRSADDANTDKKRSQTGLRATNGFSSCQLSRIPEFYKGECSDGMRKQLRSH